MQVTSSTERTFSQLLNAYAHNCIYKTKHLLDKSTEIELFISFASDICELWRGIMSLRWWTSEQLLKWSKFERMGLLDYVMQCCFTTAWNQNITISVVSVPIFFDKILPFWKTGWADWAIKCGLHGICTLLGSSSVYSYWISIIYWLFIFSSCICYLGHTLNDFTQFWISQPNCDLLSWVFSVLS